MITISKSTIKKSVFCFAGIGLATISVLNLRPGHMWGGDLFLYPGLLLLFTGLILGIRLTIGELHIAGINLDIHTLFYSGIFSVTGVILCMFYIFARLINNRNGLFPLSKLTKLREKLLINFRSC